MRMAKIEEAFNKNAESRSRSSSQSRETVNPETDNINSLVMNLSLKLCEL